MRLVHTSDLHLKEDEHLSWRALNEIIAVCEKKSADLLVIAGDLIDRAVSFYEIEGKLRGILSALKFPVLIIPGNHDPSALSSEEVFLGSNVKILRVPGEKVELEGVTFWALPHSDELVEGGGHLLAEFFEGIEEEAQKLNTQFHVLVYHGDVGGAGSDENTEGERYLNLDPGVIEGSPFNLILAGHLHKKPLRFSFNGGNTLLLYPGSPWPVTRGELNKRHVILFNIPHAWRAPELIPLEVPFYVRETLRLVPEVSMQKQVNQFLENLTPASTDARLILEVKGPFTPDANFQNLKSLSAFFEELKGAGKIFDFDLSGVVDLTRIKSDPLFAKLEEEVLNAFTDDDERIKALQYMAQIFSSAQEAAKKS